jgi:hypothetical protein
LAALARNAQAIALAAELFVPYRAGGRPLAGLLAEAAGTKPIRVGGLGGGTG